MQKYDPELVEAICQRYVNGESALGLSAEVGCSYVSIYGWLKCRGIAANSIKFDKQNEQFLEQEAEICTAYQSGIAAKHIAKEFHCQPSNIKRILKKNGIEERLSTEYLRTYAANPHFFSKIETEAQAYILGFHAADGCVYTNRNRNVLSIGLCGVDVDHLSAMADLMGCTRPIKVRDEVTAMGKKTTSCCLAVSSPQICADLTRLGYGPRKTWTIEWPSIFDVVPIPLQRHFLRGYFDGDGSWVSGKSSTAAPLVWSLTGNRQFLEGAQRYLLYGWGIYPKRIYQDRRGGGICSLNHGAKADIRLIAQIMYHEATIFLPRKREIAIDSIDSATCSIVLNKPMPLLL